MGNGSQFYRFIASLPHRMLLGVLLGLMVAGCAGYHLGPVNGEPAGSRSIEIKPFLNRTREPGITAYVGNALRKEVERDGTYRLETHVPGDIVVSGVITRYERTELAYVPHQVITPQDYTLILSAEVQAIDRATGKRKFAGRITGQTAIRVLSDMSSSERQAMPLLAEDLARNLVSVLADGAW